MAVGSEARRRDVAVEGGRQALEAPPPAGISAMWLAPYQRSFGSQPATYAIGWPSGLKRGPSRGPGSSSRRAGSRLRRVDHEESVFSERSGSGSVRLLTKAMRRAVGHQAGFESSKGRS